MKRCIGWTISAVFLLTLLCSGCQNSTSGGSALNPKDPVVITVWNYYSGDLLALFNQKVEEFNTTRGMELGIRVESYGYNSVNDIAELVLAAVNNTPYAQKIPNIFPAYTDTAYEINGTGVLVDLSEYFTDDELACYIEGYLEEGYFGDELKILPIAKSVEIFTLNKTDWDIFAAATGAELSSLETMEGITAVAECYYNWTDSQTSEPNDGKALFGRDAMANYLLVGAMQLGVEMLRVENDAAVLNFDREAVRKLWDNYYVPMVKGWFNADSRFRNDDMRTGGIISYVGSSSSVSYIPTSVASNDEEVYPIEVIIRPAPIFENGVAYAPQQGAGMVVTRGSEAEIEASVEFLKWFTEPENDAAFSLESGYLPVTKEGNALLEEQIADPELDISDLDRQMLTAAVKVVKENILYTLPPFHNAEEIRDRLEDDLRDIAKADRATVKERLEQGYSPEEAWEEFLTEEYFERWYESEFQQLQTLCS